MTHRGFQTPKPLEYFLTVCGLLALQGGAINWSSYPSNTSRIHRAPWRSHYHVMVVGGAHMGWMLSGTSQQHEDSVMRRYAPDLMKDPVQVWLNRLYFVPLALSGPVLWFDWWVARRFCGAFSSELLLVCMRRGW